MRNDLTSDPTLAALRQSVERCRLGRGKARFPESLKQQVVQLLAHYSCAEVARALSIGGNCLSRWKREFNISVITRNESDQVTDSPPGDFISLPVSAISNELSRHSNTFELELALKTRDGKSRAQFHASVTPGQWQGILQLVSQAVIA